MLNDEDVRVHLTICEIIFYLESAFNFTYIAKSFVFCS